MLPPARCPRHRRRCRRRLLTGVLCAQPRACTALLRLLTWVDTRTLHEPMTLVGRAGRARSRYGRSLVSAARFRRSLRSQLSIAPLRVPSELSCQVDDTYQGSSSPVYVKKRPCRSLPLPSTAVVAGRGRPGGSRRGPPGPPPQPPCPASRRRRARAAGRAAGGRRTPGLTRQQALGALFGRDVAVGVGVRQHGACTQASNCLLASEGRRQRPTSRPSRQPPASCQPRDQQPLAMRIPALAPAPRRARCASPPSLLLRMPAHLPVPTRVQGHARDALAGQRHVHVPRDCSPGWVGSGRAAQAVGWRSCAARPGLARARARARAAAGGGGRHHRPHPSWCHQDASLTHVQSRLGCTVYVAGGQRGSASYECFCSNAARRRCLLQATTGRAASQGACPSTAALTAVGGREAQPRRGQPILRQHSMPGYIKNSQP